MLYWRKNETPSALISGAIRGALRRGRYANRSIPTPTIGQTIMAATTMSTSTSQIGDARVGCSSEEVEDSQADERADHEDVTVREVEQLEDPVDHRVPEGDQTHRCSRA